MLRSKSVAVNRPGLPDPEGFLPADRVVTSLNRQETDSVFQERTESFLDWRVRRLDDDPASAEAWMRFYREVVPLLKAISRRGRRGLLDSEDASQEAWLVLLTVTPIDRVGEDQDVLSAWDCAVMRNRLADLKRRGRLRRAESLDLEEADGRVGREEDPAVAYERRWRQSLVRQVLEEARGRISEPNHRIIVLRWMEERTYEEIAATLGMTVDRVRDRHRRASLVLRILFQQRFGSDLTGFSRTNPPMDSLDLKHEEVTR